MQLDFLPCETNIVVEVYDVKNALTDEIISDADVKVSIYDELGDLISTITLTPLGQGRYRGVIPHETPLQIKKSYFFVIRIQKETTKLAFGRILAAKYIQ